MSNKTKSCLSCGYPLAVAEDCALESLESTLCRWCADSSGNLGSYKNALGSFVEFLVRSQGFHPEGATKIAAQVMAKQPAWANRKKAT